MMESTVDLDFTDDDVFQLWEEYFKIALGGSAASVSTSQSVVRQADEIAVAAAKRQVERRRAAK